MLSAQYHYFLEKTEDQKNKEEQDDKKMVEILNEKNNSYLKKIYQQNYQKTYKTKQNNKLFFHSNLQINSSLKSNIIFSDNQATKLNGSLEIIVLFLESEKQLIFYEEITSKPLQQIINSIENKLDILGVFGKYKNTYSYSYSFINDDELIDMQKSQDEQMMESQQMNFGVSNNNKILLKFHSCIKPKLIKSGYEWNISELHDLTKVENFTIWNEYGRVKWLTPTNVLNIDVDKILDIKQEQISLYDNIHNLLKPDIGIKLNKECEITFKLREKVKISNPQNFKNKLEEQAIKQGLEFVAFYPESREYCIKAKHFSQYIFNTQFNNSIYQSNQQLTQN